MAGFATIRGEKLDYDPRVEAISDRAYRLYLMSFYSRGRTMLGLMRFVPADVVPRVRGWDDGAVNEALEELEAAGLVQYDRARRVLFNPAVMEHSPVRGSNTVKGAWAVLAELPDSPVVVPAAEELFMAVRGVLDGGEKLSDKNRRELEAIAQGLEARLVGLKNLAQASPLEGASEGLARGFEGAPKPLARGYEGASKGLRRGSQGASEGLGRGFEGASGDLSGPHPPCSGPDDEDTTCCGRASPLEGAPKGLARGSEGASKGLRSPFEGASASRARLSGSGAGTKDPPNPPAPVCTEQSPATKSGKEREGSRYGNLGQGNRD